MRPQSTRWWIYSVSLIVAVAASIWVTVRSPTNVIAATPLTHTAPVKFEQRVDTRPSSLDIPVREFPEPALTTQFHDPFATPLPTASPVAPAVAPTPVSPPPPPTAPPLPFVYRGILTASDGSWIVQLARGNEFLLVGRGELIDSTYRLDDLKGDELIFTYLPMSLVQSLSITSDQP